MRGSRRLPALVRLAAVLLVVVVILVVDDDAGGSPRAASLPPSPAAGARRPPPKRACPDARRGLDFYRARRGDWYARMGRARPAVRTVPRGCRAIKATAELARSRSRRARNAHEAWFERTYEKWRCVHEHEGRWDDPNPTYYGGLQMDSDFQRAYGREYLGRWGTADRWPVWAQLVAAERAHRVRGFNPWPNTARRCGLL